jgi:hypothetical protein
VGIKALADLKGALVELKGKFTSAVLEQGNGRGGCGNKNGNVGAVRQSGLSELIAELARAAAKPSNMERSAVGPLRSVGGVKEKP